MKQFSDLSEFLDQAWSLLTRGVVDAKFASRNPTFSTISEEGFPTMRTVVLRRADRVSNCLEIHTDLKTNKVFSLKKSNCFAILRCNIKELDLLYLGDIHQRAVYKIGERLASVWVAP